MREDERYQTRSGNSSARNRSRGTSRTYIERDTSRNNGYRSIKEEEPIEEVYDSPQKRSAMQDSQQRKKKRYQQKKRRNKRIKQAAIVVLFVISILGGHIAGRIHAQFNEVMNQRDLSDIVDLSTVDVNDSAVDSDTEITNILLVGADKREDWSQAGRSDAVMVATLDMKHKRIKLTSLMRDMYLPIPDHGENKFNAAYSFGGVALLYKTIANNFDLKVDSYVVVDFGAFKNVINTIGGVDIELTEAEYKYLTTAYKKGPVKKLKSGMNRMNGAQALAYTRIRQDIHADFGRTERQRKVIQSIFTKAKKMSYSQLVDLAKSIMPSVSTDLTNDEILSLLTSVIRLGTTEIDQMRIPIDNSYTTNKIRGMSVLVPDMAVNKSALQKFIFEYDGEEKK